MLEISSYSWDFETFIDGSLPEIYSYHISTNDIAFWDTAVSWKVYDHKFYHSEVD